VITTSNALAGDLYGVRLTGVQDVGGNSITAATLATFAQVSGSPQAGPVVCDYYASLIAGAVITDLVNHVKYIANTPDFIMYSNIFGVNGGAATFPTSGLGDNYGIRMYSWFVPPTNGQYKFYLRADDFAEFLMNTNAVGSTNGPNRIIPSSFNSPAAQQAYHAMDNNINSKYLNFDKLNTGFIVTPGGPATVVRGIRLATAGDAPERDPGTFTVEGASSFAGPWTLIASNNTGLGGTALSNRLSFIPDLTFANSTAYSSYRVLFPTVRDAVAANSMQIAEVQLLDGTGANILGGAVPQILVTAANANYVATASVTNTLTAGQRYYMEGVWREGGGGDGMTVQVRASSDGSVPGVQEVILGNMLEFPADLDRIGPVNFNQAGSAGGLTPLNPVVKEGDTITFFPHGVAGSPPYLPVWLRNGQQVFANNQFYVTQPVTMADNGAVYTILVSNLFSVATASSTITVIPDTTAPTIPPSPVTSTGPISATIMSSVGRDPASDSSGPTSGQ